MKQLYVLAALLMSLNAATSQTVYKISKDAQTSKTPFPSFCSNCDIQISDGVTLTVNSDIYLMNSKFSGGSIKVTGSKKITFWSPGEFANTTLSFNGNSKLVSSGNLTFDNSEVTFNNSSDAVIYTSVEMKSSKMIFLDDAGLEATGGNFELKESSSLTAGDGSTGSRAYLKFNGATLYQYDQSFVTVANYNNYYYNWSNYNVADNNLSLGILNNNLNCGSGKNACTNPRLYGPATLSSTGVSSMATLPVKLVSFTLTPSQNNVLIRWTTDAEMNADRFIVQRSADGVYWHTAGEVNAKGNSTVSTDYSFNDTRPSSTVVYYRLKMVDIDKFYEFSPIKSTTLGVQNAIVIYPNPAKDHLTILSSAEIIRGSLLSDRGAMLKKFEGKSQVKVDLTGFPPGSYYLRVSLDSADFQNHKLIITR